MASHINDGRCALHAQTQALLGDGDVQLARLEACTHWHTHADLTERLAPAVTGQIGAAPSVWFCTNESRGFMRGLQTHMHYNSSTAGRSTLPDQPRPLSESVAASAQLGSRTTQGDAIRTYALGFVRCG